MPVRVVITEDIPEGALEVVLQGSDLPHAWPREKAAFESGGEVGREVIWIAGRNEPIIQVQQAKERPLVLTGAFRTHQHAQDGGSDTNHARSMRDALEEIRYRCNPLTLTWGDQQRACFLAESKFGEEGEHHITYELTFDTIRGVDRPERNAPQEEISEQPSALAETLAQEITERQAEWEALRSMAVSRDVINAVQSGLSSLSSATVSTQGTAERMQAMTGTDKAVAARRVQSAADGAITAAKETASLVSKVTLDEAVPSGDPSATAGLWQAQLRTMITMLNAADQMRSMKLAARRKIQAGTRLYQVRSGDTLESIARQALGDAGRAGQLGLRPDQLKPGKLIRIPLN
jgi:hypothetical protein